MTSVLKHNQTVLWSLIRGDTIEFPRPWYCHWGVYVGNYQVIHLSGENDGIGDGWQNPRMFSSICGRRFNKASVKKDNFYVVAMDSKARRNNEKDHKHRPLKAREIVDRARSKIGEIGYNVLVKNCEHFATWCRYGLAWSEQVDKLVGAAAAVVIIGLVALIEFKKNRN